MRYYYFSFGQKHVHSVNGFTWDKDVICVIKADSEIIARNIMFDHFGENWGMCYISKPSLSWFPRGIKSLNF